MLTEGHACTHNCAERVQRSTLTTVTADGSEVNVMLAAHSRHCVHVGEALYYEPHLVVVSPTFMLEA